MDDLERYSDYNDYGDEEPRGKSKLGLILKIIAGIVIFSVVALVGARIFLFNYYPSSVKNLYFNETLTAFYNEKDGEIAAKTQSLRAEYDNPDEGNFFADNLIVIHDANQLQVALRYNTSLMDSIKTKYGVELDPDNPDNFEFSLAVIPFSKNDGSAYKTGSGGYVKFEKVMMYRYYKLVFDDVDFFIPGESEIWIRLEITIKGVEMKEPYMVLVYEDTETAKFKDYKLSNKEKPNG